MPVPAGVVASINPVSGFTRPIMALDRLFRLAGNSRDVVDALLVREKLLLFGGPLLNFSSSSEQI